MGEIGRARIEAVLNWDAEIPPLLAAFERALGSSVADEKQEMRAIP